MRFTSLLSAFVASSLVSASRNTEEVSLDHLDDGDVHVFKRDATFTQRDLELADRDGVDLNEMYRHSVVKRDNGDHVTIWVHNSYNETTVVDNEDGDNDDNIISLSKRSKTRIIKENKFKTVGGNKWCNLGDTQYTGNTGPGAPTTGGPNAIIRWATNSCKGNWRVNTDHTRNILVAGSNGGANTRFTVKGNKQASDIDARIGCRDVGVLTETSINRYQKKFSGKWRMRARGVTLCEVTGTMCNTVGHNSCWPTFGKQRISWWIDNFNGSV